MDIITEIYCINSEQEKDFLESAIEEGVLSIEELQTCI